MKLTDRIDAFVALGKWTEEMPAEEMDRICLEAKHRNGWFTPDNVRKAFQGLSQYLGRESLERWLAAFPAAAEMQTPKKVAVIMAGNIPLVGLHDAVCVLISGNTLVAKLSSRDTYLMRLVLGKLVEIEPAFTQRIELHEGPIKNMDAIIATGSDNSSRYFDYYFSKYPHIIRKNRVSCAVITGKESEESLTSLGDDIYQYFGLGCRNVSKLFVPEGYKMDKLLQSIESQGAEAVLNHKYANNYDYNKSIYLVNSVPHLDNGSLLLKEDEQFASPIAVLYYEYYKDGKTLKATLEKHQNQLQCIVSEQGAFPNSIPFGEAQSPNITDYADGVDTLRFLFKLNSN